MTLPEITLPPISLPFDIPVLLHPLAVHFLIVLPIIILLIELPNLIMNKKAVGGVTFFLLLLTVFASIIAYLTGIVDAKEAFPALNEVAKSELSLHKLLATYLMLGSLLALFLKLLAMTGNKFLKLLYILVLVALIVLMFKHGKEGGELVYGQGLNVQAVETLDTKVIDAKEEAKVTNNEPETIPSPVETTVPVTPLDAVEFKVPSEPTKEVDFLETLRTQTEEVRLLDVKKEVLKEMPKAMTPVEIPTH